MLEFFSKCTKNEFFQNWIKILKSKSIFLVCVNYIFLKFSFIKFCIKPKLLYCYIVKLNIFVTFKSLTISFQCSLYPVFWCVGLLPFFQYSYYKGCGGGGERRLQMRGFLESLEVEAEARKFRLLLQVVSDNSLI